MGKKAEQDRLLATVALNIAALARARGKSTESMAEIVCMSPPTWRKRMKSPGSFSLLELEAIAKALGTTPQRLMAETEW